MTLVYLLRAGNRYKIGYTTSAVEQRIKSLQTGNPLKIELLGTMPGTLKDERMLHAKYHAYRVEGEWFTLPQAAVDEILAGMQRAMPVVFPCD